MKKRGTSIPRVAVIVLCLAAVGALAYLAVRWLPFLRDPAAFAAFHDVIASMGVGGWFLLLAIQYLQIVIAVIPGGPIQVLAGMLYGPLGGLTTCLLGIVLATFTVFFLARRYGRRVAALFVKEEEFRRYRFLEEESRLERLVFVLFLIPGVPKDVLTYLFALTPIPLRRFLLLSMVARIPAALTSALAGDSFAAGDWLRAIVYFLIITVISLSGLALHRKILSLYHQRQEK